MVLKVSILSIGKNLRFRTISDYMKVNYMTKIVAVKKIEIYIDGSEEEKESFYKFFRTNSKKYVQALNYVYSQKIYEDLIQENIKQLDEEYVKKVQHYTERIDEINGELKNNLTIKQEQKLKKSLESSKNRLGKLRNNKSKEARAVLDEAIGIKERTRSADTAKKVNFDFSGFYPLASKQASQDYSNDYVEIKTGKRTPRIYRYIWNRCSLPFGSRDIRIVKDDENKFYVSIPRGYRFRLFFGRKPRLIADYTDFLNKIINEEYQLNESKIVTDGKKFYFHFTFTFEKEYNNLGLDDSKSLYVNFDDIGSGNLTNDEGKELCKFGDTAYIVRFKKRIQSIKNREKSRGIYAKGSHGRKRKLNYDRWEAIKLREGNFVKTYNNQCTSRIVKVATNNKCGNIVVNSIDKENLGEWAYYQFMEQLNRKCERNSIKLTIND